MTCGGDGGTEQLTEYDSDHIRDKPQINGRSCGAYLKERYWNVRERYI
jgi:hypothetical protein